MVRIYGDLDLKSLGIKTAHKGLTSDRLFDIPCSLSFGAICALELPSSALDIENKNEMEGLVGSTWPKCIKGESQTYSSLKIFLGYRCINPECCAKLVERQEQDFQGWMFAEGLNYCYGLTSNILNLYTYSSKKYFMADITCQPFQEDQWSPVQKTRTFVKVLNETKTFLEGEISCAQEKISFMGNEVMAGMASLAFTSASSAWNDISELLSDGGFWIPYEKQSSTIMKAKTSAVFVEYSASA